MGWFKQFFGKGSRDAFKEGTSAYPDREIISLLKGRDKPFIVDHTTITHVFMLTPEIVPTSKQLEESKSIIDKVLCTVNPELWPIVLRRDSDLPTIWLINNRKDLKNGIEFILNSLSKFVDVDQRSIYVGTPSISLDDGKTVTSILIGFAFKDDKPKDIISSLECKPHKF